MKGISKEVVRSTVEGALDKVLKSLKIVKPSKKTRSVIKKISKKYSDQLRIEIKKLGKKNTAKQKSSKKKMPVSRKAENP
jgi:hypothetical protein